MPDTTDHQIEVAQSVLHSTSFKWAKKGRIVMLMLYPTYRRISLRWLCAPCWWHLLARWWGDLLGYARMPKLNFDLGRARRIQGGVTGCICGAINAVQQWSKRQKRWCFSVKFWFSAYQYAHSVHTMIKPFWSLDVNLWWTSFHVTTWIGPTAVQCVHAKIVEGGEGDWKRADYEDPSAFRLTVYYPGYCTCTCNGYPCYWRRQIGYFFHSTGQRLQLGYSS